MIYKLLRSVGITFALSMFCIVIFDNISSIKADEKEAALGTAWVLNESGYIVTANHVVKGRNTFKVVKRGLVLDAELIVVDAANDIAILRISEKQLDYLPLQLTYIDSEPASMFGYPLPAQYGDNLKTSSGTMKHQLISNYFRIYDAKVCPGNSGGPLIGTKGVIGVITESVFPFTRNNCSVTAQGPTSDKVAALAKANGIVFHESKQLQVYIITDDEVMEIYAWNK